MSLACRFTLLFVVILDTLPVPAADTPSSRIDFARQIRPILSGKCFKCHGPDQGHREADLRLSCPKHRVN